MGNPKKSKKYYAVIKGHINKPTIFSSWYHLLKDNSQDKLINGSQGRCIPASPSKHRGFYTIHKARIYMELIGVDYIEQLIDDGTDETAPLPDPYNHYAVANGPKPGIYLF
ncbi:uncharacterized protein FOBCDRAFT_142173 [Fusarium oxysporum Fo47]|uniref:Uncharacterized protein n=1 Tax=Fusarium oxysporum Fo47 TaxID=660027 RepID=W9JPP3_FUSOX|nr:uncharacterized protein FOBCDRAFT_142173 [Fusarium oxysporum Fo47]EWZ34047.1 hypothetical protein FOZG_12063 [Fusarium oxysporum Fo47]WJG35928.1 hypothetical protein FOBCDRAFT_142173 [Fusarium oxysporum Fo47]